MGCFLFMNIGSNIVKFKYGLFIIIVWGVDGKVIYVLEGSIFIGGVFV